MAEYHPRKAPDRPEYVDLTVKPTGDADVDQLQRDGKMKGSKVVMRWEELVAMNPTMSSTLLAYWARRRGIDGIPDDL
jgi:hypothetical protein